jgi:hypothetical protein
MHSIEISRQGAKAQKCLQTDAEEDSRRDAEIFTPKRKKELTQRRKGAK